MRDSRDEARLYGEECGIKSYRANHLAEQDIARLIDGVEGAPADSSAWRHLRSCRRCFEVYRDAAIYRGLWEAGEWRFRSNEELIAAGERIAAEGSRPPGDRRLPRGSAEASRQRHPARAALAGVAAVLAVAVLLLNVERGPRVSPDAAALAQVRRAVEMRTLWGPLIFPGTENMKATEAPRYRSAYVPMTDSLGAALSYLFDKYQRGGATADEVYWLVAGNVAAGRLEMAEDLLTEQARLLPGNVRIAILRACLASDKGDRERAEGMLRSIVDGPLSNDVSRVNLASILLREGRTAEARDLVRNLGDSLAGTVLGARTDDILGTGRSAQ